MNEQRIKQIMSGERQSAGDNALRLGLGALAPGYRAAVALRNALFDAGLRKPARLGRPTISVGNLTTGGTGKTPMVIELVHRLAQMGETPAVLLRGYGADEVRELSDALRSQARVHADADRRAGAATVLRDQPGTTIFVLDDGFQHRQVHRDLDLVLIDAAQPFGYGHVLPRGMLREPAKNLARADGVIVTRCEQVSDAALAALDARITTLHGRPPLAHAAMTWACLREQVGDGDADRPIAMLRPMRVAGVCGVGNPQAFFAMLEQSAGQVVMQAPLADHQHYDTQQLAALLRQAHEANAQAVVTTEKDYVKWRPLLAGMAGNVPRLPILRPELALRFIAGESALDDALRRILSPLPLGEG